MATAASIAAPGSSNEAKKPSPVCLMTSPPLSTIRVRTSLSCSASSLLQRSSPRFSSSLVEPTMSVKRNVRCVSTRPSSSFARSSSSFAPSRSNVVCAACSSRVAACSSPWCRKAMPSSIRAWAVSYGAPIADLVGVDDLLELRGGRAGRVQVAGGERDLGECGQHPDALQRLVHLRETARDTGHRAVHLSLGQLEEGQTGLGRTTELVRGAERLLGGREIAATATDLADLVVAARGDEAIEVVDLLAGRERRLLGLGPVAAQAHDLGAVNAAGTGEPVHVLLLAPAAGRLRPLRGAPVVADVLAGRDRRAVDEPGCVRAELAGHGRRAGLVEDREPLLDVAPLHERPALADERQDLRVTVACPSGDLMGPLELREGVVDVALREQGGDSAGEGQKAVLPRFRLAFQKALRVREPSSRDGEGAPVQVVPRERQRETGRTEPVARGREARVRPLAQADRLVDFPGPPSRVRELLLVVGGEAEAIR